MERDEPIQALAKNLNHSGFKASALRSVLTELVQAVQSPDDEKVHLPTSVATIIEQPR